MAAFGIKEFRAREQKDMNRPVDGKTELEHMFAHVSMLQQEQEQEFQRLS